MEDIESIGGTITESEANIPQNGTIVWFDHPDESWILGSVEGFDIKKKLITVVPKNTGISKTQVPSNAWLRYKGESTPSTQTHDLLNLVELHESTLLDCVKKRFFDDLCYTYIGSLVLSINPFKWTITNYQDDQMVNYIQQKRDLVPHAWSVADRAFRSMKEGNGSQTIIISGESGAGKTEGAKTVLKYLTSLSCTFSKNEQEKHNAEIIALKIQETSPILEAFGNAKTLNNDNSSRFGKFIKLQFDSKGIIKGADISNYLLEKTRVIACGDGERCYHIFYQLVRGASDEMKKELGLRSVENYSSLRKGNCLNIEGIDDAHDFKEVIKAMNIIDIEKKEQSAIFRIVAAILHIQNINFSDNEEDHAVIDNQEELETAASLLEVTKEVLGKSMVSKTVVIVNRPIVTYFDSSKARDSRDALCKTLYTRLFSWIVQKVNSKICASDFDSFIGLLDIFGFEQFKTNTFEQFCINYANEALQGHYNFYTFKLDIAECEKEGIDVRSVPFNDNTPCINLIQGKHGILDLLDEHSTIKSSDSNFLAFVKKNFSKSKYFVNNLVKHEEFTIKHYAGDVPYICDAWLEKNKDATKEDMLEMLHNSKGSLIKELFPQINKKGKPPTVGGSFKKQLNELLLLINSTTPHWIRCIKPHKSKKPGMFHNKEVMSQLKSSGVLETIRIRKEGYSVRIGHLEFWRKFRVLLKKTGDPQDVPQGCKDILNHVKFDSIKAQVGKTKVFLRNYAFEEMEILKGRMIAREVINIQRVARGFFARQLKRKLIRERDAEKLRIEEEKRRIREEKERKEREERERIEAEKRRIEEEKKRIEEERRRAEEERIRREKEEQELRERLKREKEEAERKRLEEIKREREEREQELKRLEEKIREKERKERERERIERERMERERIEREKRERELKRMHLLWKQEEIRAQERKEKEIRRLEKLQQRRLERIRIEREAEERKRRVLEKLEREKQEKIHREREARRLQSEARKRLEMEKKSWERVEYQRLQQELFEAQRRKEIRIEQEHSKQRKIEFRKRLERRRLEERAHVMEEKYTKSQMRQINMKIQKEEQLQEKMKEEERKLFEIKRFKEEEKVLQKRRQVEFQYTMEIKDRRDEIKKELMKKMRDETVKYFWKVQAQKQRETDLEQRALRRYHNEALSLSLDESIFNHFKNSSPRSQSAMNSPLSTRSSHSHNNRYK